MNRRKFVVPDDSMNTTMMQVPNEQEGIEMPSLCSNYSHKIGPKLKISMPGTTSQPQPHPLGKHSPGLDGRNTEQFSAQDATLNLHFAAEIRQQETSRITPCTTAGLQNNSSSGPTPNPKPGNREGLKIPSNPHNHSLSGYFSHEKSISFNREMFDGLGNESRIELNTQVQSLHRKR